MSAVVFVMLFCAYVLAVASARVAHKLGGPALCDVALLRDGDRVGCMCGNQCITSNVNGFFTFSDDGGIFFVDDFNGIDDRLGDGCVTRDGGATFTEANMRICSHPAGISGFCVPWGACLPTADVDRDTDTNSDTAAAAVVTMTVATTVVPMAPPLLAHGRLSAMRSQKYTFLGAPRVVYTLFSAPHFVLNMQLSHTAHHNRRIEQLVLVFRDVTHVFTPNLFYAHKAALRLNHALARAGGKALVQPFLVQLELCAGYEVEIVTRVTRTRRTGTRSDSDRGDIYHLDVAVTVPGCGDAFDGVLGQTYRCKYASGDERFAWSPSLELANRFRVDSLAATSGTFSRDVPCHIAATAASADQLPLRARTGRREVE